MKNEYPPLYICKQDKDCSAFKGCKKNGGPCYLTFDKEHGSSEPIEFVTVGAHSRRYATGFIFGIIKEGKDEFRKTETGSDEEKSRQ